MKGKDIGHVTAKVLKISELRTSYSDANYTISYSLIQAGCRGHASMVGAPTCIVYREKGNECMI